MWRRVILPCALLLLPGALFAQPVGDAVPEALPRFADRASRPDTVATSDTVAPPDTIAPPNRAPEPEDAGARAGEAPPGQRIFLGGASIVEIRDPLGHPSLAARARAIQGRLLQAARDPSASLDQIGAVPTPYGARLVIGDRLLFHLTRRDVAPADTSSPAALAEELVPVLRSGLERERERLRPVYLLRSTLIVVGIFTLCVLVARFTLVRGRRLSEFVGRRAAAFVRLAPLRALGLFEPNRVASTFQRIGDILGVLILLAIGYAALSIAFSLFPWTQGWSHRLVSFAQHAAVAAWISAAGAVPRLVAVACILFAAHFLIRGVAAVLDATGRGAFAIPGLHPELARPTKQLLRVFLWTGTIVIVYPLLPGSETPAFRGVSILLGAVVSLGSSGLVQDLLAGLVLTYSRSYRVGERVATAGIVGDVVSLGLLTSRLRTIKNEEVTIGNAQILRSSVTNYSRLAKEGPGLILHTAVTIGYDTPWPTVHRLLIEAAGATEGIEKQPAPFVLQRALSDFYVEYEINATTRDAGRSAVLYGLLHQNIQDAFRNAGVEIMSPHYRSIRDGNPSTVPQPK